MSLFFSVIAIVFPVFFIIGAGFSLGLFKKISLDPLIDILIYLAIPALVISSLTRNKIPLVQLKIIPLAVITVIMCTGILSFVFLHVTGQKEFRGFYLPVMFMNSGNMAFPLSLLAFGEEGLTSAVIYYVTVGIIVYSLGIYIARGKGGFTEIFKLPLIYSAALGIGINMSGIRLPPYIDKSIMLLGEATIPLMLVSLGYRLSSIRPSRFKLSAAGSIIRIGGGLLTAYLFVTLLGISGVDRNVIILSSSMPSAVISFILSHRYQIDTDLVASTVGMTTIFSIITVPVVISLILFYAHST